MLSDTNLDKLLNRLHDVSVELFDLYSRQVHVTQQTVDDLKERQLHTGDAFIQQLSHEEKLTFSNKISKLAKHLCVPDMFYAKL